MIRVLVVCSGNSPDPSVEFNFSSHQAFIAEQVQSLEATGSVKIDVFLVKGKGILGYLSNYSRLRKTLSSGDYDLVHAHFSLSGLLASMQRKVPVVVTFHGSDVNDPRLNFITTIVHFLAKWSVVVEASMKEKLLLKRRERVAIIPCGVNLELFSPASPESAREALGLSAGKTYILFSSSFDREVKNAPLAIESVDQMEDAELLQIKDRSREEVAQMINAADALLMTSFSEGSPQIIKEALACNLPVVSTDVGDVADVLRGIDGCFICDYSSKNISERLKEAISFKRRLNSREHVKHLETGKIAEKLLLLYSHLVPLGETDA